MTDLSFHGNGEQNHPIEKQNGPKHGYIKYSKKRHKDTNPDRSNAGIPSKVEKALWKEKQTRI